jgi:hypothetical protein
MAGPHDLARHAQAPAELVVDEAADVAAPVALEARLAVELGRRQRVGRA